MNSHAENTKRIAKNTLMLYVRMLFSMLVSLYTSRVVLNTLGVEDYGIYNVVGGLVSMFSLISSSLSSAVSRFLTFELGRGDMERLKQVFSTSLLIHAILAVVIVILAETLGIWFLNTHMTIPPERLPAARWVLHASTAGFALTLLSVPYNASIVSHEKMDVYAWFGVLNVVLYFLAVLFLAYAPFGFDKLKVYSLLLFSVSFIMRSIYASYSKRHFEECRFRLGFDKQCWKELSSFAGWNFIGCTAGLMKDQGVNILLNIFCGPVVNAARGIAMSVNRAISSFSGNFMTALNPQITKSYAATDYMYMMSLVERGSRFSFYILLILTLPILFETDFVLTVWLKQYPDHTVSFVRLVLLLSMLDVLSNTLITLQMATGKIRNYQIAVGGMLFMNFPLSWAALKIGMAPEWTLVIALFLSLMCLMLRLLFLRKMAGLSMRRYMKNVCLNVLAVTMVAMVFPMAACANMGEDSWFRFIVLVLVCVTSSVLSAYFIGCSKNERAFFRQRIISLKDRIFK